MVTNIFPNLTVTLNGFTFKFVYVSLYFIQTIGHQIINPNERNDSN